MSKLVEAVQDIITSAPNLDSGFIDITKDLLLDYEDASDDDKLIAELVLSAWVYDNEIANKYVSDLI